MSGFVHAVGHKRWEHRGSQSSWRANVETHLAYWLICTVIEIHSLVPQGREWLTSSRAPEEGDIKERRKEMGLAVKERSRDTEFQRLDFSFCLGHPSAWRRSQIVRFKGMVCLHGCVSNYLYGWIYTLNIWLGDLILAIGYFMAMWRCA